MSYAAQRTARTQSKQRVFLLFAIAALAVLISAGTVYTQRTPALSTRAMFASVQEAFLSYQLSDIPHAPPSGKDAVSVPVLTYHRIVSDSSDINNVTASNFKDQMVSLKKAGWETVTLQEFEEFIEGTRTLPERSFVLTFDDGARDSFYPVDPILAALDYEAVNFIIVKSSEIPHTTYYLTPREIDRMLATGRWAIGSHSNDGHRPYPVDDTGKTGIFFADRLWITDASRLETDAEFTARVEEDLATSKKTLEEKYSRPIASFAFPLGNETGLNGANNFPEGSALTEAEARKLYRFGHLQLDNQRFQTNFPRTGTTTTSPADDFRVFRVHVDYDWDGARVLSILENTLLKPIPYEDDFAEDHGWLPSWGSVEIGRNNLQLAATPDTTSASAFLDGTALWDNYSYDAAVNWQNGHAIVLGDVVYAGTYRSCVFSPGVVRIQETVNGLTRTLKETANPAIAFGDSVRIGMRSHGKVTECAWDFTSVAEDYSRQWTGGIGVQVWDETPGRARLTVSSVIVRPNE